MPSSIPSLFYICPRCSTKARYDVSRTALRISRRFNSTETAPPPLFSKFKTDLKTAMKAKDTPRLNVLRSMITEYNNAGKTSKPITKDIQLLAILRKKKTSSEAAIAEAKAVNREDLVGKQEDEIKVIDEYASTVELVSEDTVRSTIQSVVEKMKETANNAEIKAGLVIGQTMKSLEGQAVESKEVSRLVNELLSGKSELQKDKDPSNTVPDESKV